MRLKIQALVDNELPEDQIDDVLRAIRMSDEYTAEYADLLRLKQTVAEDAIRALPEEWLEKAEKKILRRIGRGFGQILFIGSYVALLGYSVFTMFRQPAIPVTVTILVSALLAGVVFLLGNAIADRVREGKDDKYRGIIR